MIELIQTYELEHLLLFTEETYLRYFEIYNQKYWPLFIIGLLVSSFILFVWRASAEKKGRALSFVLFLSWVWIACAFFISHYADINWAADYLAWIFFLGGGLLFFFGVLKNHYLLRGSWWGISLIIFALYLFPFVEILLGKSWVTVSLPFISPTPTALLTVGFMTFSRGVKSFLLLILSLIWLFVAGLTSYALFH